jgi:hypothetical protein
MGHGMNPRNFHQSAAVKPRNSPELRHDGFVNLAQRTQRVAGDQPQEQGPLDTGFLEPSDIVDASATPLRPMVSSSGFARL